MLLLKGHSHSRWGILTS